MQVQLISKPSDSTWEVLAAVRFVLATIVVAVHLQSMLLPNSVLERICQLSAMVAVLGFLIVSGFSIGHSVSRRTDGFYRRRLLRIYPLYAASIIVPVVGHAMRTPLVAWQWHDTISNLFFLQTFTSHPQFSNPVLWTLAVEAACYALAPWFAQIGTPKLLAIGSISAIAFMIFPRLHENYYAYILHGQALIFLGWSWLAGFIYYRHRDNPHAAVGLALCTVFILSVNQEFTSRYYMATLALTLGAITMGPNLKLSATVRQVFGYCGDVSFPLYLFHVPVFQFLTKMNCYSPTLLTVCALASAMVGVAVDVRIRSFIAAVYDTASAAGLRMGVVMMTSTTGAMAGLSNLVREARLNEELVGGPANDSRRMAA